MWVYLVLALAVGLGLSSLRRPAANRVLVVGTLVLLALMTISQSLIGAGS